MTRKVRVGAVLLFLALAACGRQTPADKTADQLDQAAEQSDPAAADVLENRADAIRANETASPSTLNMAVQNAMESAGNSQARTVDRQTPTPPSSRQAVPHGPGDPTPPPTTERR